MREAKLTPLGLGRKEAIAASMEILAVNQQVHK